MVFRELAFSRLPWYDARKCLRFASWAGSKTISSLWKSVTIILYLCVTSNLMHSPFSCVILRDRVTPQDSGMQTEQDHTRANSTYYSKNKVCNITHNM